MSRAAAIAACASGAALAFGVLTTWSLAFWTQAAAQSVLLGVALGLLLRWPAAWRHARDPLVFVPALAAGWAAVQASVGWSVAPWQTWNAARDWWVHAAVAAAVLSCAGPARFQRAAQSALLAFTVVVAAVALLQIFSSPGRVFWLFASGYDNGVYGPFVYRNKFAQFVELAFPIAVWRVVGEPRQRSLHLAAAALLFAAVVASASRSGFVLLLVEAAAVTGIAVLRGRLALPQALRLAVPAALLLACAASLGGWSGLEARLFGLDPLADKRLAIHLSTLRMILARPWIGWGLGAWDAAYPEFASFDPGVHVNQAHNDWLQWAAEGGLGLPALLLFCAGRLLRPALRSGWGIGVPVVLLHGLVDYPMQQAPLLASLLFAVAALAARDGDAPPRATPADTFFFWRPLSNVMERRICALLIAGSAAALCLAAQTRIAPAQGPMADAGASNLPGQRIGPHDLIAVSVYDAPEFTRTLRVAEDGTLRLPMIVTKIRAAGLLPAEVESEIARALSGEGLFVKPVVVVTVVEYHSRPIAVVGSVRKPLTFQSVGRVTLLDALARAEGLTADAGPEVVVIRPAAGDVPRRVERISVRELFDEAGAERNLVLLGGEEIRVPEARRIFVTGNVKHPGAFAVREGGEMTVLKALALAEGLAPFSSKMAFIYRPQPGGSKEEIAVPLARIIERKNPDVGLLADDVLYVPEDRTRRNTLGILERAVGFGASTASGVLIWRR